MHAAFQKIIYRPLRALRGTFRRAKTRVAPQPSAVRAFLDHIHRLAEQEARSALPRPEMKLMLAFVAPTYNTRPEYLDALLASLRMQPMGAWELILTDDGSTSQATLDWFDSHADVPALRIVRAIENRGIAAASNAGLAVARAPWVGLIDHDDALAPWAVDRILRCLDGAPDCQFLYTDEVITDGDLKPVGVFLKPAFDPVMLSGVNYINHLSLYRRDRLLAIGGLREGFEGSQDYDLLLRYTRDLKASQCLHLPYPAYIWRRDGGSYSSRFMQRATAHARAALAEAYGEGGDLVEVSAAVDPNLHRVRFDLDRAMWPMVSIIIPSRNQFAMINRLLGDLVRTTNYPNFEIIVIDNGSTDPEVLDLYDSLRAGSVPFRAVVQTEAFNFARLVNKGMALAKGDLFLLLNNDIEPIEPGWIEEMVACFQYENVGIVGAKLLYPDDTIQHAGVIVGFGGYAGHWYLNSPKDFTGPMARLAVRQSLSCVTGACMMVSRALIERIGPMDEERFAVAYNDVDLCMRAVEQGVRVIWTPFACLRHHESATRGSDETPENIARFQREKDNLKSRHATDRYSDFAISPWYTKDRSSPGLDLLTELPGPR